MESSFFTGLFDTSSTAVSSLHIGDFLLCCGTALLLGAVLSLCFAFRNPRRTHSFLFALAILPAVVSAVILMVNGNLGAGVAVAGAFSLVRFRSAPGTAKEIAALFLGMASGLICGMGYLGYAALFTLGMGILLIGYQLLSDRFTRQGRERILRITVPEDVDYPTVLPPVLSQYTARHRLLSVKTTGLGSLFRLTYAVSLKDPAEEKAFLDALRCRNSNLEISLAGQETGHYEEQL